MSITRRRRLANVLLEEMRSTRAELRELRREFAELRAAQDPAPRARGEWQAIFGAAFALEMRDAQPRGLDDDAVDRAIEEAEGTANWAAERRSANL